MDTQAIKKLDTEARQMIASTKDLPALEEVKNHLFSKKKGQVTALLKEMKNLTAEERPAFGKLVNDLNDELTALWEKRKAELEGAALDQQLSSERIDITLPGRLPAQGNLHPISATQEEILNIFQRMGFSIRRGPEIEDDWHNFQALNFPPDHPARDMQDTIFVENGYLLRTQTSPVQIRTMLAEPPPVQFVAPGAVYRHDDDVSHSPMFHQVEGLFVDKGITFADLKGSLTHFLREYYGGSTKVRFRSGFFPFTEPSAEIDIGCVICGGSGCRVCKRSGWIEILGCGMVHPAVFEHVCSARKDDLYDPARITGYAFGMGIERVAMLKYGIGDIRLLFQNDIRFLEQFNR